MNSISFNQKDFIGYIILNRPKKRNALSLQSLIELEDILQQIKCNNNLEVVIIKGNGKDFCAGHDLSELCEGGYTIHHYRKIFSLSARIMQEFHNIPQPIIAQIHGNATAAGCQLVAACDLAVAEKSAVFSTPGVKIGLFCSTPMVPLCRSIGRKKTLEMLFTGKSISAEEAKRYGLINKVVEKGDLEEETKALAYDIARYSPEIITLGKKAFYHQIDHHEADAYHFSKEVIALNCLHEDAQEGMRAMLERRKPHWWKEK